MKRIGSEVRKMRSDFERLPVRPGPEPECRECGDTRWVDAEGGGVRRCSCFAEARAALCLGRAGLPAGMEHCTFEGFDLEGVSPYIREAHAQAERFAREWSPGVKGLLFAGNPGTGKTHLAIAIVRTLADRSVRVVFRSATDLLADLQATFDSREPRWPLVSPLLEADVLVLDELGQRRPTEWAADELMTLLGRRYAEGKTTCFTTNYGDREGRDPTLEDRVGPRLRSRLHGMTHLVYMIGDDFRRRA